MKCEEIRISQVSKDLLTPTSYYEMVCEKIEAAAKSALNQLQEVFAGWGNAYADIGVNRRKESDALDKRLGILKVCAKESDRI